MMSCSFFTIEIAMIVGGEASVRPAAGWSFCNDTTELKVTNWPSPDESEIERRPRPGTGCPFLDIADSGADEPDNPSFERRRQQTPEWLRRVCPRTGDTRRS